MRFYHWRKSPARATSEAAGRPCAGPVPGRPAKMQTANRLNATLAAACLAAALAGAGCATKENDEMTKGVISGERPVAMSGTGAFFGGRVATQVTVSRGIGRGLRPGKGGQGGRGASADRKAYNDYENSDVKQTLGSPLPPVTLHLVLTNTGGDEIAVRIIDFDSDLGNFVVDPDTVTIPAGRSAEPTPMVSQLGVSADEIPFKVRLQLGKASETRTIVVRNVPAGGAGAPP